MSKNAEPTNLAEVIRRTFRKSGMSMKQLSERADVPYASVHGLIQHNRDVTLSTTSRLCGALGLELRPVRRGERKT